MAEKINDNVEKPKGVVPKNAQTIIIIIVSIVVIFVLLISGNGSQKNDKKVDDFTPNPTQTTNVNEAKLNALKKQLEEQSDIINQQQNYIANMQNGQGGGNIVSKEKGMLAIPLENDEITKDIQKKEYISLFSSPVAKSNWEDKEKQKEDDNFKEFLKAYSGNKTEKAEIANPYVEEETDNEKEEPKLFQALQQQYLNNNNSNNNKKVVNAVNKKPIDSNLKKSFGKDYKVFEGTVLECVLMNRLNGTFAGPVNLMVTTPVYSHNRQHLLIPKGSFILGEAKSVKTWGQERLAIVNHRLTMPDGYSVTLDQFKGLNQIGETGLKDKVNYHYFKIFGASIALGILSGWADSNQNYSNMTANDYYRSGVSDSFSRSSIRILDKFLNIMPEVIIREGHRVKVYISQDMLLPDYKNHLIENDI